METAVINNNKIKFEEHEIPTLEKFGNGAIIKVLGSGLCGSDIIKYQHHKNGIVLGHEIVGEITKINSSTDFKTGDLIVMGHHIPCGRCKYCLGGSYSMCSQFKETNIKPGGFSQYIYASELHLQHTTHKIPENLSLLEASFMEPLGCCIRAVERADLPENSTVLVVGLGSIGLLMGQAIKAFGHKVFGLDLLDERLNLAKKLGFNEAIKYKNEKQVKEKINELSEIGADAVFLTAGAKSSVQTALNCIRNGGTILVFASVNDDGIGFSNNDIYYRELKVLSTYSSTPQTLKTALEFLSSGKVKVDEPELTTIYELNDLQAAIDDTISNKIIKAYIRISDL